MMKILLDSNYRKCLNTLTISLETPLYIAVTRNNTRTAILLIEEGADISLTDINKASSLHKALMLNNIVLAILLVHKGSDVHAKELTDHNTPLHEAMLMGTVYPEDQILPLIKLLLEKGVRWDIPNKNGLTAKDIAIKLQMSKIYKLMKF
jgi:ankyrin repeat protein